MRLVINNTAAGITNDSMGAIPSMYDFNYHGGPGPERGVHLVGGTGAILPVHRGKIVNMRLQARSLDSSTTHMGVLAQERGTRVNIWLNFKRNPSYNP